MNKNHRAVAVGIGIIAMLSSASMILLYFDITADAGLGMWASLVVAGFVTGAMAHSRKLLLSVLLVLPASLLFALENWLWQLAGKPADHVGVEGSIIVLLMSIPFGALLCAAGGVLGLLLTRGSAHRKALQDDARNARA